MRFTLRAGYAMPVQFLSKWVGWVAPVVPLLFDSYSEPCRSAPPRHGRGAVCIGLEGTDVKGPWHLLGDATG